MGSPTKRKYLPISLLELMFSRTMSSAVQRATNRDIETDRILGAYIFSAILRAVLRVLFRSLAVHFISAFRLVVSDFTVEGFTNFDGMSFINCGNISSVRYFKGNAMTICLKFLIDLLTWNLKPLFLSFLRCNPFWRPSSKELLIICRHETQSPLSTARC